MIEFLQSDPKVGYSSNQEPGTLFGSIFNELTRQKLFFKSQYMNGARFQNV